LSSITLAGNSVGGKGGAIYNAAGGTLTITGTTFTNNIAIGTGGGIGNAATLTLNSSSLNANHAGSDGGAISNLATMNLTNASFVNNLAIGNGGAIVSNSSLNVAYSTFMSNSAASGGSIANTGTATFSDSILANNLVGPGCSGVIIDGGYNLEQGHTCGLSPANHSLVDVNPLLGTLSNNGGPTQTVPLLPHSPALDITPFGVNGCGTTVTRDGRGDPRPMPNSASCDSGAYEAAPSLFVPLVRK
jgi:predicted outer membrane repeat protein